MLIIDFLYSLYGAEAKKEFHEQQAAHKEGRPYPRTWLTLLELTRWKDNPETFSRTWEAVVKDGDSRALAFADALKEVYDMEYDLKHPFEEILGAAAEVEKDEGLPEGTIRRDIHRGRFNDGEYVKVGRDWVVSRQAVKRIYKKS